MQTDTSAVHTTATISSGWEGGGQRDGQQVLLNEIRFKKRMTEQDAPRCEFSPHPVRCELSNVEPTVIYRGIDKAVSV
jgi:hypothetical protein